MADQDIELLIQDKLSKYGDAIVTRIREKLLAADKLASGDLYNSITFDVKSEGGIVTLNIYANDYFQYVDKGRLPGKQPPIENILKWVQLRGIHPRPGSGIPARSLGLPKTDRSLAFLIARKIGLLGIKPTNILESTLEEVNDPLAKDITAIITEAIIEIIGSELQELAQQINNQLFKMTINYF